MRAQPSHWEKRRILMTIDAVGGVWRYAMDLAAGLRHIGVDTVFLGFGPEPSPGNLREAQAIGHVIWSSAPLDWMAQSPDDLTLVTSEIRHAVQRQNIDLVHLNLPSQAADLALRIPVIAVSHSCVATWFRSVRGEHLPKSWQWQWEINRKGFDRADLVLSPSMSHAKLLREVYGPIDRLAVVHNSSQVSRGSAPRQRAVFSAGRWWDEGKNGGVLDQAADRIIWPVTMAGSLHGPSGQEFELENAKAAGELFHPQVIEAMACASIFVSPSIYEPFGLAALEAARQGAALVLSDIPTYRELWDGAAAFFQPTSPDQLARAVNHLARDPVWRRELVDRAERRASSYSLDAQVEAIARHYRSSLTSFTTLNAMEKT